MLGKEVPTYGLDPFRTAISAADVAKGPARCLDQFHAGFNTLCFPSFSLFSCSFLCICLASIVFVLFRISSLFRRISIVTSRPSPSILRLNLRIVQLYRSAAIVLYPFYDLFSRYLIIYFIMRFSAVAALCAAPLVLAGAINQPAPRMSNQGIEVSVQDGNSKSSDSKGSDNGNSGSSKSSASSVDEVIIIWVNEGGGAATSTVTNTVTVTDASGTSAAKATHSVCWVTPSNVN
jgi:hypothetical protein